MTKLRKTRYLALVVILSGAYTAVNPSDVRGAAVHCEAMACGNPGCSGPDPTMALHCATWNLAVACDPMSSCSENGYVGNLYWCEHDM